MINNENPIKKRVEWYAPEEQVQMANTIVIGEIGLSGELRRIQNITKRIEEAQKMGFTKIIIPNLQSKEIQDHKIKVIGVSNLKEAISSYFSH